MVWITGKLVEDSKKNSVKSEAKSLSRSDAAPPEDIEYGIATEPHTPRAFKGRHGIWACEACNSTILLGKGTKKWTCKNCGTLMYTTPIQECPLEKARRFILHKKDEFDDWQDEEAKKRHQAEEGAQKSTKESTEKDTTEATNAPAAATAAPKT